MDLLGLKGVLSSVFPSVEKILDETITNKEELAHAKAELLKVKNERLNTIEQEVTKRWESDNNGSWLTKNIRPLVLAYLVVVTTLLIFIDGGVIDFVVDEGWRDLLQVVLITTIGAYFGSRGLEKINNGKKI